MIIIDKSSFISPKENVYIKEGVSLDQKIFRYTNLSNLLMILGSKKETNGQLFVSRKSSFSDKKEKEFYAVLRCLASRFSPVSEKEPDSISEEREENGKENAEIREACKLCTSCWTYKDKEDYLMWKAYSNTESGLRIGTTVRKLVCALDAGSYEIYGAKIAYGKGIPCQNVLDSMFNKAIFYEQEKEFRLYINDSQEERNAERPIRLNINPQVFIEEITLSPFMGGVGAKVMKDMLSSSYPYLKDKIQLSQIMEYK
ncbi:hypothetical protein M2137_001479 [Parabacteroides sp. PFB2-10]|uniref:hypothetical protein n=1 Tax=Parabacteroides sp. PFB2-10 TaxID=1742405 RepID=UPI002476EB40|nr:hypothetical protein [Parabacteroides sp. PFB2-10]MDH6312704.1 hypothetical protein [Parabacteroides sp. PFB2-10]